MDIRREDNIYSKRISRLVVTYEDNNQQLIVLLVRNRASKHYQDKIRSFYNKPLTETEFALEPFMFPGGEEDKGPVPLTEYQKAKKFLPIDSPILNNPAMQSLLNSALLRLNRKTALDITKIKPNAKSHLDLAGHDSTNESGLMTSCHYFHFHLGSISEDELAYLHRGLKTGGSAVVSIWYPLIEIQRYPNAIEQVCSVLPDRALAYVTTPDIKGLPSIYYSKQQDQSRPCVIMERHRPASLDPHHAQWIFAKILNTAEKIAHVRPIYIPSPILLEEDFEVLGTINVGRHDNKLARHVPTGRLYILKYLIVGSEREKNILANARQLRQQPHEAEEAIARNEILTQKLYELHHIRVPELTLVRTAKFPNGGYIVASAFQPDYTPDNKRIEQNPPEEVYDGFGCDVAFANYDAVGSVYKIPLWGDSRNYNIGLINQRQNAIRIDVSAGLNFRALGLLKTSADFSESIDLAIALNKDKNPGFYFVFAQQMNNTRWQRAFDCLRRVTHEQRAACILQYGYGTEAEKTALARLVNTRVENTILQLERKIVRPEHPAALPSNSSKAPAMASSAQNPPLTSLPVVNSSNSSNALPVANPHKTLEETIQKDIDFSEAYTALHENTQDEMIESVYSAYRDIYRLAIQGKNFLTGLLPEQEQQALMWAKKLKEDCETHSFQRMIAYIQRQRLILTGEYKAVDIDADRPKRYGLNNCPIAILLNIFNWKDFVALLKLMNAEQLRLYVELLTVQIKLRREEFEYDQNNVNWLNEHPDTVEQSQSLVHDYERDATRLGTLIKFLENQVILLNGQYRSDNRQICTLMNATEEQLAQLFQDRYILRQFQNLNQAETQMYILLLSRVIENLIRQQIATDHRMKFAKQILQRIEDFARYDQIRVKLSSCMQDISSRKDEESENLISRIILFYPTITNESTIINRSQFWQQPYNGPTSQDSRLKILDDARARAITGPGNNMTNRSDS